MTWDPVEPVTSEPVVALGADSELPDRIAVGPKLGEVGGSITEKEIQLVQVRPAVQKLCRVREHQLVPTWRVKVFRH